MLETYRGVNFYRDEHIHLSLGLWRMTPTIPELPLGSKAHFWNDYLAESEQAFLINSKNPVEERELIITMIDRYHNNQPIRLVEQMLNPPDTSKNIFLDAFVRAKKEKLWEVEANFENLKKSRDR